MGASKVARDITSKVQDQRALRLPIRALRRANEDLQQFAHSASHDLQEPLRMVVAYSQLLEKKIRRQTGDRRRWLCRSCRCRGEANGGTSP